MSLKDFLLEKTSLIFGSWLKCVEESWHSKKTKQLKAICQTRSCNQIGTANLTMGYCPIK